MEQLAGPFSKSVEVRRRVESRKEKIDEKSEYDRVSLHRGIERKSKG